MRLGQAPRARLVSAVPVADAIARHDRQPVAGVDVDGGHVIGGGAREAERPQYVAVFITCEGVGSGVGYWGHFWGRES